jgi:hypothetical protein
VLYAVTGLSRTLRRHRPQREETEMGKYLIWLALIAINIPFALHGSVINIMAASFTAGIMVANGVWELSR